MFVFIIILVSLCCNTFAFNSIVVGNDLSSKLSSIILAKRGHCVQNVQGIQDRWCIENSNYLLTEEDMTILNTYNIPYHDKSIDSNTLVKHDKDGSTPIQFGPFTSISKLDLLNIMDKEIAKLNIEVFRENFEGIDPDSKILYLSGGSKRYDLLIDSSGIESKIRQSLTYSDFHENIRVCTDHVWRNLKLDENELNRLSCFSDHWIETIHMWREKSSLFVASPTLDGGIMGQVSSPSGSLFLDDFPDICRCIGKHRVVEHEREVSKNKEKVFVSHFGYNSIIFIGDSSNSIGYERIRISLEDCVKLDYSILKSHDIAKYYDLLKKRDGELYPRMAFPIY